jgi:hypothetical protein
MFCGYVEVGEREYKEREEELNPTLKLATPPAKAQPIADIPGRVPTCATPKPNRPQHNTQPDDKMPDNVVESPYPLIDADPHFSRVVRYMRPSDYAVWASATAAFPSALYFWGM